MKKKENMTLYYYIYCVFNFLKRIFTIPMIFYSKKDWHAQTRMLLQHPTVHHCLFIHILPLFVSVVQASITASVQQPANPTALDFLSPAGSPTVLMLQTHLRTLLKEMSQTACECGPE